MKNLPGKPMPLGATYSKNYTQFSVFSRNADAVSLLFFDKPSDSEPTHTIKLDPEVNKTGDIWHVQVKNIKPGQLYAYCVDGPYEPWQGQRFNKNKLLIDPYAKAITGNHKWKLNANMAYNWNSPKKDLSFSKSRHWEHIPKSIVVDDFFDWEGDRHPKIPLKDTIIYETHLKTMTSHESSPAFPGATYKSFIKMIPYFKKLGVTAVELLPIQEFDENENFRKNPLTGKQLHNYWGYSTIAFFAPKGRYAESADSGAQVREFKEMVKAFHSEGLEIILDVVFNHTGEGNERGPSLSFRGFDNTIYYMLERGRYYKNYSGCGNTMNCNHPIVRDFILDCLRYWVTEMHIDGFRFDLASILGRAPDGTVLNNPPLLERIAEDPILRNTKIIAEAWDAAGVYQVGSFPGGRWAEWNGKFRDSLRSFWKGDENLASELATRIAGSSDLYQWSGRQPCHSINFITCHDGFTLTDLVSYNGKHNEANGEYNCDGDNHNLSYNYGVEGATDDQDVNTIRLRQKKNFIASLMLAQGVPMIYGGDEIGRTKNGNNNTWCHDNELSWIDWEDADEELREFVRKMIAFRKKHPAFRRQHFFKGESEDVHDVADINWYSADGSPAEWTDEENDSLLAFFLSGASEDIGSEDDDDNFYVLINASADDTEFSLPPALNELYWEFAVNTANDSAADVPEPETMGLTNPDQPLLVKSRSMIVLTNPVYPI